MPEQPAKNESPRAVAPGYPAIETLRTIDASDWEPAAVFKPFVEHSGEAGGDSRQ